jgi:Ni,Fe-hydrogenase III large subunit/Ni,Fe-hydrogenase III component G
MLFQNYLDRLTQQFPDEFFKHSLKNTNELYLEVHPESLPAIAEYVYRTMGGALVSLFANDERPATGKFAIYYVFAITKEAFFIILKTGIDQHKPCFQSITNQIPAAQLYEREIKDLYGLNPEGHPDPRRFVFHGNWPDGVYPLRKDFDSRQPLPFEDREDEFTRVDGTGVYEIPVGPVHAGIIEPGHFRFSVAGEPIINLEAQLFFVHKGIEKLCEGADFEKCFYIAERISGDETFTNSFAYCQAIEKIAGVTVPLRADYSRVLFAELERLVSHLGDLAGICVDVAYGFGASQFRMLRGWTYLLIEEVSGSRFLRSVNQPGGLRRDFIAGNEQKILESLARIHQELIETINLVKSNSLFIDRVENTGILPANVAVDLNAVGPPARAAGVNKDLRRDFSYSAYGKLNLKVSEHHNGDVNCRMNVKLEECITAIDLIRQVVEAMPPGAIHTPITRLEPYQFALGYTEAPRGENLHWLMTGEAGTIYRYKIRTPSFCNWPALCYAVRGNIVPDFPLINKSFNLSYAGNDL